MEDFNMTETNTPAQGVKLDGLVKGPSVVTANDAPIIYKFLEANAWATGYNAAIENIDTDAIAALVGDAVAQERAAAWDAIVTLLQSGTPRDAIWKIARDNAALARLGVTE